jgi:hypothetical protein
MTWDTRARLRLLAVEVSMLIVHEPNPAEAGRFFQEHLRDEVDAGLTLRGLFPERDGQGSQERAGPSRSPIVLRLVEGGSA